MDERGAVDSAQQLIEAGEYERAADLLRGHADADDTHRALYLLGLAEHRSGNDGAALDAFSILVDRAPEDPRAWYSLAIARERVGDAVGAAEALDQALRLNPDFAPARKRRATLGQQGGGMPGPPRDRATLADRLEDGAAPPESSALLAPGRRRVSSIGDAVLGSLALAVAGIVLWVWLSATAERLAAWSLLGRTPGHFRDRLADLDASNIELGRGAVERDLQAAMAALDSRTTTLESLLGVLAVILPVAAIAIVIGAVVAARLTRYDVYEHRIDITSGLLRRRTRTLWLYSLTEVVFEQPLWLLATGNARIRATADSGPATIVGYGDAEHTRRLWAELREAAVVERRAMRRWWV